ncbi:LysR family transcriptional regulator [Chitinophaga sedimenti]|uniref:LysR family transcriptional regulator n=1 Tax=Chitinophaga sedimenti TaxID=2033606 RepID=UPI002004EA8A|nr:LysR family transcriptional regulator [Chitinophaga sedimenti]MCK7555608.1 LysR family transcriptional regulator [Chitinophaga sedimenti]
MVNFEWYRTFKAIYQQGNLTRAAQELMISQPNVSVHLAALENYTGGLLFERLPRKMVPTELGKQLYAQIIGSVESLEKTEYAFTKNLLQKKTVIRIGVPKEFFHAVLAPKLAKATSKIDVQFGSNKELMQEMEKGNLDFVIATQRTNEDKQTIYESILEENFVIVGSANIKTATFKRYLKAGDLERAEKWLLEQDWYAYSNNLTFIRKFWLTNFRKRPLVNPKYVIPDLNTITHAISNGNGISIISDCLLKDYIANKTVKVVWEGDEPATNTLYLAYNKSQTVARKIDEIKGLLKNIA